MITIQRPLPKDVLGIQKVFYETWLATYQNKEVGVTEEDIEEKFKNRFSQEAIQKRTDEILNITGQQLFLVAKDGDGVIGLCQAEKRESDNRLWATYVLPSCQRKGVGMMFWEELKKFFGDKNDTIVHVAFYNVQAINFYKKLGFIETGKSFTEERYKMPISGTIIPEIELILKVKHLRS